LIGALAALVVLTGPSILPAEEAAVIRVEEDWLLWVYEPDGALFSPQFHTVMSPLGNLDSYYYQVTWNYRELPSFMSGGFQVQSWNGEATMECQNVNKGELSRSGEIITWTQVLETNGNQIAFSIINGVSTTWGTFGHPNTTIVHDGSFADLNQYSPTVSVANSWITYGQNRVVRLGLMAVRYYGANGLLQTDPTDRILYQYTGQ